MHAMSGNGTGGRTSWRPDCRVGFSPRVTTNVQGMGIFQVEGTGSLGLQPSAMVQRCSVTLPRAAQPCFLVG